MTKKLTPWFPGTVAPVRLGVYERQFTNFRGYAKWNNRGWLQSSFKRNIAGKEQITSELQLRDTHIQWRGFTTPQGESK